MKISGSPHVVRADKDTTNKTCRHWFLRVHTDQGRKQKRFTGTYSQAKEAAQTFATSLLIPQGKMLFKDIAAKWLKRRTRSGRLSEATLQKDGVLLRRLVNQFGEMHLCDLTYSTITDGLLEIKESNDLGNTYCSAIQEKLKAILTLAVKEGELATNPALEVDMLKRDKTSRKALTADQLSLFIQRLEMEPLESHTMALRLLIYAGLRRGESVGLNWDDIDLTNGRMTIRRSVAETGKLNSPKTAAGVRVIPLMQSLTDALKEWQRVQDQALASIGIKQTLDTPVITSVVGTRLNPQNFDRWWRKNRASYGLEGVVLHELRHTFATMLANSGAKLHTLPDIMGWANINMVDTYVHTDEEINREAIQALEGIMSGVKRSDTSGLTG